MRRAFLVPKPGLKVPKPDTGRNLAEDGEEVVIDRYWMRRLEEGCVTEGTASKKAKKGGE